MVLINNETVVSALSPELDLFFMKMHGVVQFEHLIAHGQALVEHPLYRTELNCLCDCRAAIKMEGAILSYQDAAELIVEDSRANSPSKNAYVIANDNRAMEDFVKAFILMSSATQIEQRIFNASNMSDALDFLNLKRIPDNPLIQI